MSHYHKLRSREERAVDMRILFISFGIFVLAIVATAQTRDYCKQTLCQSGRHIGCGNKNKFASTCPKDAKIVKGGNIPKVFVSEHNLVRNIIASGNLAGYGPAMRMATVQWDGELAKLAQMQVKTCEYDYDECRNTDRFSYVGQNIATRTKIGFYDVPKLIREVVTGWFAEYSILNKSYVTEYSMDTNYDSSRHFAQLSLDKATRIGCAMVDFTEDTKTKINVVCNYSARPKDRRPLYVEGCSVAQCIQGHNVNFMGLCASTELFDPNNF